jgi:predicted TIM-barrel fold metal-dependent hydrolase
MPEEFEPQPTNNSEQLVEQNSDADDTTDPETGKEQQPIYPISEAGAYAEDASRTLANYQEDPVYDKKLEKTLDEIPGETNYKQVDEVISDFQHEYHNEKANEAMIVEAVKRAEELVSGASPDLQEAVAKAVEEKIKQELYEEAREQAEANAKAKGLLEQLKSDKSIEEILSLKPNTSQTPESPETPPIQ